MPRLVQIRPLDPSVLHHPAVVQQFNRRAADVQLRIADRITAFAGSMRFVYLHAVLFVVWMLVFEASPWPTLTLIVSLEAIFLSTFVMIGQSLLPAGLRRHQHPPGGEHRAHPHHPRADRTARRPRAHAGQPTVGW